MKSAEKKSQYIMHILFPSEFRNQPKEIKLDKVIMYCKAPYRIR